MDFKQNPSPLEKPVLRQGFDILLFTNPHFRKRLSPYPRVLAKLQRKQGKSKSTHQY